MKMSKSFSEFFAGGGMASQGLGPDWRCLFANDIDCAKAAAYRLNKDPHALTVADIHNAKLSDLPGQADPSWASFSCQDLSLAGSGAVLVVDRSGVFWPFWNLMKGLARQRRSPKIIALENAVEAITSNQGRDLAAIATAFAGLGYRFGYLVIAAE